MHDDWSRWAPRWRGIRSELIDVHGTAVHALRADGPPDQLPLLLVHGLGGSATNWLEVLRPLSTFGTVLAPDLPGFGRTEPPGARATRVGGNSRFLRAFMDAVGWERAIVVGNSMGGTIATLFADLHPDRVERLVLVSPALPARLRHLPQLSRRTLVRFAPFAVPGLGRAVLRRMWARMTPEQLWQEGADYVHADPSRVSVEMREVGIDNLRFGREAGWRLGGFVAAAESVVGLVLPGQSLNQVVDRVHVPTMVLWGDADQLVGRPVMDALARRRPDWRLEFLEGVGHVPHIEVPELFVSTVTPWLGPAPSDEPAAADLAS